jgi:hypothetical protein
MFEERSMQRSRRCLRAMRKDNTIRVSGFVRCTLIILFVLCHQRKAPYGRLTQSLHQQVCPSLEMHKYFNAMCGLCEQLSLSPSSDIGRWSMRDLEDEQALFLDPCLTDYRYFFSTHIRGHSKMTGVCSHCLKNVSPLTHLTVSNNGVPVLF